jgi:hypothetical protein
MPPSDVLNGSPTPNPSPSTRSPLFGFGEPRTPADDLLSSPHPNPESPAPNLEDLAPDSADDWADETDHESPEETSSPASTRVANPLGSEGLRDMFRGGVVIASSQAHNALARSEGQKAVGLYLADAEDAERIGDPLARVAGRHQGIGKVNPDTADLLAAMVGLTRYATKQIQRANEAKQIDGAGAGVQPMPEAVDL